MIDLAIALGLGLLVGLQREWSTQEIAGIRTFGLITIFGAVCGLLAASFGGWIVAAGMVGLTGMIVVGNVGRLRGPDVDPGITTEVAALLMFGVGVVIAVGHRAVGVVVAGSVAVLLYAKAPLHAFVRRIGEADLRALFRLVLVGLVILPILPDRTFGPYDVLNPFRIWLMVVLIVGISLAAYAISRLVGPRVGTVVAGVLGGLISSTATTVGYARRAAAAPRSASNAASVIIIASAVVFARATVEIAIVSPAILAATAPPLVTMGLAMSVIAALVYGRRRRQVADRVDTEAPGELRSAIGFGLVYAIVLLGVAFAKEHLGSGGLYLVAALSGLTDMDAITLSTAQMVGTAHLEAATGWRLILVGAMANVVFKGVVAAAVGPPALRKLIAAPFAAALACGAVIVLWWPG